GDLLPGRHHAPQQARLRDHRSRGEHEHEADPEALGRRPLRLDQQLEGLTLLGILLGGVFHAAVLFLVAAGLQLVFGVTKILSLACGSFYALGGYAGVSAVRWALGAGLPVALFLPVLLGAGLGLAVIGPVIERLLRPVYDRDESFQLLLTFALVLMFEDVIRFFWGTAPHQLGNVYLAYGRLRVGALTVPTYNLVVIACGAAIALGMGLVLARTRFGRIVRATAENREMAEAMGVDMARVYSRVFTLGGALGIAACAALLLLPFAGRPYTTTLLLPAFGYAIALLGLNLLFGSAGLLSFGHALFVALGGYTAALLTSRLGVRHLEIVLLAAAVTAALVAVPVGLLCVRYV